MKEGVNRAFAAAAAVHLSTVHIPTQYFDMAFGKRARRSGHPIKVNGFSRSMRVSIGIQKRSHKGSARAKRATRRGGNPAAHL